MTWQNIPFPGKIIIGDKQVYVMHQKQNVIDKPNNLYMVIFSWHVQTTWHQVLNFPPERTIFCCNSVEEQSYFSSKNMKTILCSDAAIRINPDLFIIKSNNVEYDAVYNAGMLRWKNHLLAKFINNLSFIYYEYDKEYQKELKEKLPYVHWINEKSGSYRRLQSDDVAKEVQKAGAGLCLSFEEGAMLASVEYLLCGKPIVSVKSKGGREHFFENSFVRIVEPDCQQIKLAVDHFCSHPPDADYIRQATVTKLNKMREAFIEALVDLSNTDYSQFDWHNFKPFPKITYL
jgi:glycosyltransferase involved in cell wall biosynthesis